MSWLPLVATALGGVASYYGSRSSARAQEKMMREAMAHQEKMRAEYIKNEESRSEQIRKLLGDYASPFYEDSKKISRNMANELEGHERDRLNPQDLVNHPVVKSIQEQTEQRMRPMMARMGLYGSSVGNDMAANAVYNNGLNTVSQLTDMHNKTRDSIASSGASALSQTQKMPEAFASGVSSLANTQANALGNVETGYERNMAGFGQNRADVQGQKYKEYGNLASSTIGNVTNDYLDKKMYGGRFQDALLKQMKGGIH